MELPLPQDVITHVITLGHWCHAHHDLAFAWHDGSPIIDLDDPDDDPIDPDYEPSDFDSAHNDDLLFVSESDGAFTTAGVDDNDNNDNNNENDNENMNNNNDYAVGPP